MKVIGLSAVHNMAHVYRSFKWSADAAVGLLESVVARLLVNIGNKNHMNRRRRYTGVQPGQPGAVFLSVRRSGGLIA